MTLQEFQQSIREGIPAELPAPKPYDPEVNHAPKRPPGRLRSILESGWDETGCASVPSTPTKTQA